MTLHKKPLSIFLLASALLGIDVAASAVAHAATIVIINNDGAGEGFYDPTAAAPVGGNTGTTIGQQRLIAFQRAADIWAARITSSVTIRVGAQFNPLSCTANSAILGQAGPSNFFRDFGGAPVAGTWYAIAEANALNGNDIDPGVDDISATFSSTIGTTGCLETSGWYYGLDGNTPGNRIDFVSVLVHELGHGLGFLTLVNLTTGAKALGFNDTYMRFLENHGATPPDYPSMDDAQRVTASTSTGNLHWTGANVRAVSGLLTAGAVGDHVRMYAPNPAVSGSSVSHWDTVLTPSQVMEPNYTGPLHNPILEMPLFKDIGWTVPARLRDFNGDFKSDILWRDTSGTVANWLMNGSLISSSANIATVASSWSIVGQRDFNGDGKTDILWRDTSGNVAMWFMNGTALSSSAGIGNVPTSWTITGTADFNGDGKSDILWRNTSGTVAIWLMNGSSISSSANIATISSIWSVSGTGDFNGDGKADILWRDTSGNVAMWFMNGTALSSSAGVGNVPNNWSIIATGDFNGDGVSDILWRDTSGTVAIWLMNGSSISSSANIATVSSSWSVSETGDFNGDGKADILWRDTSGNVAIWFMNGTALSSSASVGNVPTSWTIQSLNAN